MLISLVASSGCVGLCKDLYQENEPTIKPTVLPASTVTPIPVNPATDRLYQYTDRFYAGLENYNLGITYANRAQDAANASDWGNSSECILTAKSYMEKAKEDFKSMEPYANYTDEMNLSRKWYETADYSAQCYSYLDEAYKELAYQSTRDIPNNVKTNYYYQQARYYHDMARQSRQEAETIEGRIYVAK